MLHYPPTSETLRQALGSSFDYYYEQLRESSPLVLKLSGSVISYATSPETMSTLQTLHALELPFVVVHGGSNQISTAQRDMGITPQWDSSGNRVTDAETLNLAGKCLHRQSARIVQDLDKRQVSADRIGGVLTAEPITDDPDQYTGRPLALDTEKIRQTLADGRIPILNSLGATSNGQILNVKADAAATQVAVDLGADRLISLTRGGGLRNKSGKSIPTIILGSGDDQGDITTSLSKVGPLKRASLTAKMDAAESFLAQQPDASVVLTKPSSLIRELFTHQGEGTLIRRGDAIDCFTSLDGVNTDEVRKIIEDAFGERELSKDYFEKLPPNTMTLVTARRYHGVAIVLPGDNNNSAAYLDKIAVSPAAQGAGVGKELIEKAIASHPDGLYWRTRSNNPQNVEWYTSVADQYATSGEWTIFGVNIADDKMFKDCVARAASRTTTI